MFDVSIDDRFLLLNATVPSEYVVVALDPEAITLRQYPEGETFPKETTAFALEHAEGNIVRTARAGEKLSALSVRHLLTLFRPEGRQVTLGELEDWQKQREAITHAATKQFYANKYIDQRRVNLDYTKTEDDLAAFISAWFPEAEKRGLDKWKPSATTIRNLVRNRVGHVSLVDCLRKEPAVRTRGIWPEWTYVLASEAIDKVFRREFPDQAEAYRWFYGQFYKERDEGVGILGKRPEPPTDRVFRTWFKQASTPKNLERAHGSRKANKSLKGAITPQDAVRPLQIVIIDQTLGNMWSAVKRRTGDLVNRALPKSATTGVPSENEEGQQILAAKRVEVVYAVDVFSRMTLGLILTFEPPSIRTFMACLKMVMTPKVQWRKRFPDLPDATDGYGPPETVVLDNLRVHVTDSVQLGLLSMSIGIEYAALASPEWKAIVERAIGTCKRVMATLPGGFSIDDDSINPADFQKYARLDLDEIDELTTHKLITEHHMRPHRGTGEPPGLRWANGLRKDGRDMVNDMRLLDLILRRRKPKATLTRNGVYFKGHRYHHEGSVTRLLAMFSDKAKGKPGDPYSLEITVLWKPHDCSSIGVMGPGGETVELPNCDPLFAKTPVSFKFASAAKKANEKIFNLRYPPETRAKYLREYFERLEQLLPKQSHRAGKTTTRLLEGGRAVVIAPDVRQYEVEIPVTDLGVSHVDIPIAFAAEEGRHMPETPQKKGPPRKRSTPAAEPPSLDREDSASHPSYAMSAADSEAYLDQLEAEMKATRH
ncbi:putative transposase [Rhizobium sp. BK313]|uniref:DDE-type integrase/transposase/recombinase n=1 Tax=Rhizobium sp. BK313 TaxID=2587081 RepID=UPI00105FC1DF|nr:DDE-type integrase/transposase/recombinase [Rhizobium sp. BK313]MBB3452558.1 putative transposase [Rhizobium sp. BK313]